jgi:1,5-anhydro-D-fructose reductase (1,5-anhydro-D-mannitol-forming)
MKSLPATVRWGIIGCGDVCEVKSGPAFNKVSNSVLTAVMRRNAALAEDFAKRHNVPKFYDNAEHLINDPNVNAIYVATPPSSHEEYTKLALQSGKPVYVEKPVSTDAASCRRMIESAERYGGRVSVAHYRRGLPLFWKVKSLITEGAIGNARVVELRVLQPPKSKIVLQTADQWRIKPEFSGGGLFHDLSPHQLDIIYWIFGAPREVSGRSFNQSKLYQAPDVTLLQAVYQKDVCLSGVWAFNVAESATEDTCEIIGDRGKMRFSFFKKSTIELATDRGTEVLEFDYPENIQLPMIDAVAKYFRGEGENPCSLHEALIVMQMMDETLKQN